MKHIAALMFIILAGCSSNGATCQEEPFFCYPGDTWKERAKTLGNDRLVDVHVRNWKGRKPPSSVFVDEIGTRGSTIVPILLYRLQNDPTLRDHLFFGPIVKSLRENGGPNLCITPEGQRLSSLIRESRRREENVATMERICAETV